MVVGSRSIGPPQVQRVLRLAPVLWARGGGRGGGLQGEGVASTVARGGHKGDVLEELAVVEQGLKGRQAHQGHPRRLVMNTRVLLGGRRERARREQRERERGREEEK